MQNTPPFSSATSVEALRLQFQHRVFFREIGTLIPDTLPITEIKTVLDIPCGLGTWSIDLARAYSRMDITGIDGNPEMIRFAIEDAQTVGVSNVSFQVGNMLTTLPCLDAFLDFVYIQMGNRVVPPQMWPSVFRELFRVLRPGRWINVVDFEPGPTSSPSLDIFLTLVSKALVMSGRSISPDGLAFTSAVLYPRFLSQAGCVDVTYRLYPVNLGGWNNPTGRAYIIATLADGNNIAPLLVQMGLISQPDVDNLLQKIRQEVQQIDFCGVGMLISALGRKPV